MGTQEEWRPVVGYEGLYEVSDFGRVKSLHKANEKIMKQYYGRGGYLRIDLHKDKKKKSYPVHKLVWEAIKGKVPDDFDIDHRNFRRDDNRIENLLAIPASENRRRWDKDARERVLQKIRKEIIQIDKSTGEVIRKWTCSYEVEKEYGFSHSYIIACCRGKYKTAYGFIWRYAD